MESVSLENLKIGDSYKVIQLEKYGGALSLSERKFRELEKGEILVKIMCSTIHPADISFLTGTYGSDKPELPLVPGFEGSGIIVQVAEDVDKSIVGKRCGVGAFSSTSKFEGLWAQYHYTKLHAVMTFDSEISYDSICFTIGNPLTSVGFLDTVRKNNACSVGQNGASSSFGKIFIRLCKKEGIKTLNVVRKECYIEPLKLLGADYVLNSSDPNFDADFKRIAEELNIQNFFECVGGNSTGKILSLLPPSSTLYHFGNLELKRLGGLDTGDFIFKNKSIRGWWLSQWTRSLKLDELLYWKNYVVKGVESEEDLFKTTVSNSYPLEEYEKAFEYYMTNMSEGKVIIRPNI